MTSNKATDAPFVLLILDGWGHREEEEHNAIAQARTPVWDELWQDPKRRTLLKCSGNAVGLPEKQMGSSEVGHMNIGAGRIVYQDYNRIRRAMFAGKFPKNKAFQAAIEQVQNDGTLHLLGLLSPGGVHSDKEHFIHVAEAAARAGVRIRLHAFLDGRDTPPKSAKDSLDSFHKAIIVPWRLQGDVDVHVASLCGRFYAMDRDQRWERTEAAYDLLTNPDADVRMEATPEDGLAAAYDAGETDEFVKPTRIGQGGLEHATIKEGDAVIFMNFRSDRARQLSYALSDSNFQGFARKQQPTLSKFVTMTHYADDLDAEVAFPPKSLTNTLGEYLAKHDKTQLRVAETEKYAHVTFFFSGGCEDAYEGEERILVPSPKDVETYDLKPEMSADAVADAVIKSVANKRHDVVICNFANADMVGHTGKLDAAKEAVSVIDRCLGRITAAVREADGQCLITADHGNVEIMQDTHHDQPHTAHTSSKVPLVYAVGDRVQLFKDSAAVSLADIAPTMLKLMGMVPPKEMTRWKWWRFRDWWKFWEREGDV